MVVYNELSYGTIDFASELLTELGYSINTEDICVFKDEERMTRLLCVSPWMPNSSHSIATIVWFGFDQKILVSQGN